MKGKSREILKQTLIYVFGKLLLLIMSMMRLLPKSMFMKILQNRLFSQCLKDIMRLF